MADRTVSVAVSRDRLPTVSDHVPNDVLSIEPINPIILTPGHVTQINLIICNNSQIGRMARVSPYYDTASGVMVQIPEPHIYIAPQGRTLIYALIEARLNYTGNANINFRVH